MTQKQIAVELTEIRKRLDEQAPRPLRLREAAEYLGISTGRLYFLTSKGLIPHYKPMGKLIYFQKRDLDAFVLCNRVRTRGQAKIETGSDDGFATT